jgi:hypothetical protein
MPNELKNTLNASTSLALSRHLPVTGASSGSGMVWTLSGLALASCIGGGGGGSGGGPAITDPLAASGFIDSNSFTRSGGRLQASHSEVRDPIRFNSAFEGQRASEPQSVLAQLEALGATYSHARRIDDSTAMYVFDVENHNADLEYRAVLGGDDGKRVKYVQNGDHVMVTAVASFDFDKPIDEDGDNTYRITETGTANNHPTLSLSSQLRTISETYTISINDHLSDNGSSGSGGLAGLYIHNPPTVLSVGTTPSGGTSTHVLINEQFSTWSHALPEGADGSVTPIRFGEFRSTFEGTYTLRLKATGTNDNSKFELRDGILYYTGTDSGDFEDVYQLSYGVEGRFYGTPVTIEVEYMSGQTVFFTETYIIGLSDVNVPVTATETAPNVYTVTTPESSEEIHITDTVYPGNLEPLSLVTLLHPQNWYAVETVKRQDDGTQNIISLGGPDKDKFHIDHANHGDTGASPVVVESREGFDYEARGSAAGTNTYKFTLESDGLATIMYEIIITDLEGALDPQMNDL